MPHQEHKGGVYLPYVGGWARRWIDHLNPCDASLTVTFPATQHHRPFTGTKLYCLVNRGTCVWTTCTSLLPDSAPTRSRTCNLRVKSSAHYTTRPPQTDQQASMLHNYQAINAYFLMDVDYAGKTVHQCNYVKSEHILSNSKWQQCPILHYISVSAVCPQLSHSNYDFTLLSKILLFPSTSSVIAVHTKPKN